MAALGALRFPEVSITPSPPPAGYVLLYVKTDEILYLLDSDGNEVAIGSASVITALTGDVTATGPGAAAATVALVGGQTAADVATAVIAYFAATPTNTPDTLVLRDGSGDFSAGTITADIVGDVNGIDILAHGSRHLPAGADPLTTAAPLVSLSATTANAVGTANSFSRSDHEHDILTGVVSTIVPDQVNAEGSSANLARADHIHNIPSGTPVQIGTSNFAGAAASFALSDHVHAHGDQTSGTLHAAVTASVNGFMSAADKVILDAATTANTAGTIVKRDGSGNFTVGTITGNITGVVTGGIIYNQTTKTGNYTILSTDSIIFCDTSGGAFSLTLPSPSGLAGKMFIVIDSTGFFQTNNLTLVRSGSELLEGLAASKVLQTNWGWFNITTNGTNWFVG